MSGSVKTEICGHKFGAMQVHCLKLFAEKGKWTIGDAAKAMERPKAFVMNCLVMAGVEVNDPRGVYSLPKEFVKALKSI